MSNDLFELARRECAIKALSGYIEVSSKKKKGFIASTKIICDICSNTTELMYEFAFIPKGDWQNHKGVSYNTIRGAVCKSCWDTYERIRNGR